MGIINEVFKRIKQRQKALGFRGMAFLFCIVVIVLFVFSTFNDRSNLENPSIPAFNFSALKEKSGNWNCKNLLYGDGSKDDAQVKVSLENEIKKENALAQYCLAVLYEKGYGQKPDLKNAKKWYLKAAEQDYTAAQHSLGIIYITEGNDKKGEDLLEKAIANALAQGDELKASAVKFTLSAHNSRKTLQKMLHGHSYVEDEETPSYMMINECSTTDVVIDSLNIRREREWIFIVGNIYNTCAKETGVEVKITLYDEDSGIITTKEFWPNSTNNIPAGAEFAFEWMYETDRTVADYKVQAVSLKSWE